MGGPSSASARPQCPAGCCVVGGGPSLDFFLGFLLCQHKFQIEIRYIYSLIRAPLWLSGKESACIRAPSATLPSPSSQCPLGYWAMAVLPFSFTPHSSPTWKSCCLCLQSILIPPLPIPIQGITPGPAHRPLPGPCSHLPYSLFSTRPLEGAGWNTGIMALPTQNCQELLCAHKTQQWPV